jgi:hypothetical protein
MGLTKKSLFGVISNGVRNLSHWYTDVSTPLNMTRNLKIYFLVSPFKSYISIYTTSPAS